MNIRTKAPVLAAAAQPALGVKARVGARLDWKRLRRAPPPGQAKDEDWPLATRVQAYMAFALGIAALLVAIATPLLYIGTWTMGTAAIVLAKVAERGYADLSTWTRWAAGTALLLDLCAAGARLFLI